MILGACAPQVVTQVVKETQIVKETSVIEKEKIVEKLITPTPLPEVVTPQGRVMLPDAAPLEKQIYREALKTFLDNLP